MIQDIIYQKRLRILQEFIENLQFEDCSNHTFEISAEKCGYTSSYGHILFEEGVDELIDFYANEIDQKLANKLKNLAYTKIREKIFHAVKLRLELYDKEAVRKIVFYKLKKIIDPSLILWNTADYIWRLAGDTSTDWNYYSKRMILSGVYGATLIYWLNDDSEENEQTWKFLQSRIDNIMNISKIKHFGAGLIEKANKTPFLRLITKKIFVREE